MSKGILVPLAAILLALCGNANASVTVYAPANNATVRSPVRFTAAAWSAAPITGWVIYDHWTAVYRTGGRRLDTNLNLSAGTHDITVKAWDIRGRISSTLLMLNVVQGTGGVSISISPTSATVVSGQTTQFSTTVQGTSNTGVAWFVAGVQGGNSSVGLISQTGVYTAPATQIALQETVTAKPLADLSKSANATVAVTVNVQTGGQYYVSPNGNDSGDGSAGNPWRTLSRADASVRPGDTVHVAVGPYNMDTENGGRLKTTASGTASARIRWISDQKWGAKLHSSQTGNSAVWWNQGNYVDIQGFDLSGSGALGIYNEGSYTRMIANHVHDVLAPGCPAAGGGGILDGNYSATGDDMIGNWVHDIGQYDYPCQRVHGIYHANQGGHIYNNVTFHNGGWGIHLWHAATNVTISNNTVFGNGYGGMLIGAVSGEFPGGSGVNDNTLVTNNIVFRNGLRSDAQGYGIEEYGDIGHNNRYINNLVSQNGPADFNLTNGTQGTINANPMFNNYQDNGSGDYHLQAASPAIGAGTAQGQPSMDYDNAPRPQGGDDLGAYQHGVSPGPYPME